MNTVFIDPDTSAETPVKFRFEYNSDEEAFGFRNEQNMFVSFKSGEDSSDATAYPQHILSGFTAYARGEKITGEYIPLDTSDANATAENIESGYTAYVNGIKITGSANIVHGLSRIDGLYTFADGSGYTLVSAASTPNHAIFAGGEYYSSNRYYNSIARAFDSNMTKTNLRNLTARSNYTSGSIGNYALFGGGTTGSDAGSAAVNVFDVNLIFSGVSFNTTMRESASASNDEYILFAGSNVNPRNNVCAFDTSLTRSIPTSLSDSVTYTWNLAGSNNKNYILFTGGHESNTFTNTYDSQLTRSNLSGLDSYNVNFPARATHTEDYILIAGYTTNISTNITCYDNNLSKQIISFSIRRRRCGATNTQTYAIFAGGETSGYGSFLKAIGVIECFDNSLTRSSNSSLSESKGDMGSTSIISKNIAFFGGGEAYHSTDDVYKYSGYVDAFLEI